MNYDIKINKLPHSEVKIECSLPSTLLYEAKEKAIKKLGQNISIDGFRKGNVPEKIILQKIGEQNILSEAVEIVINEHFSKILEQARLDTIGRPSVSIKKIALGNPIEFEIIVAVIPEFELPNYKKISGDILSQKNKSDIEVTEKEIEEVLLQIRKNKAHFDYHQKTKGNPNEHDNVDHPNFDDESSLPPLDDNLAQAAGKFKNIDELKDKVKENIKNEKINKESDRIRALIMESLLSKTNMDIPNILIDSETEKSITQMKDDIARMNGKWEEYLSHIKKDEKKLREELKEQSEKKAKIQLIFNAIAKKENLKPDPAVLENEINNIIEHYKEANKENVRIYIESMLTNQEVLKLLEQR